MVKLLMETQESKPKLFIDVDGVLFNSIKTIVDLYNNDFKYYPDYEYVEWCLVKTWDFTECKCATAEYIDQYFNQPRFFETVQLMEYAGCVIDALSDYFDITFVSMGNTPNLICKQEWFIRNMPDVQFIGVNFDEYEDKAHIDMSEAIFIDDSARNLETSNAAVKICFGDKYPWNDNWDGDRCYSWAEVLKKVKEYKGGVR